MGRFNQYLGKASLYRVAVFRVSTLIWGIYLYLEAVSVFWRCYLCLLGVDRYVFFRADTDTDYYRSSRPITDILNRYTCLV